MNDTYKTITGRSEGYYTEKKSKFYAFAYPVETLAQVKQILKQIHKQFYDARHIAYAYVLDTKGKNYGFSDGGEPAGSAGQPILQAIRSADITRVMVAVVRYFGGKKLGYSGLINAYRTAAKAALDEAKVISRIDIVTITIGCDYKSVSNIMRLINQFEGRIKEQDYSTDCKIIAELPLSRSDAFISQVKSQMPKVNIMRSD